MEWGRWLVGMAAVVVVTGTADARPAKPARRTVAKPAAVVAEPSTEDTSSPASEFHPAAPYTAALLIDRDSGQVLFAKNEHLRWPPASMTKMMTVLIAMEQVRSQALRLDDGIVASAWASKIGGSQVYLAEGEQFQLGDLLASIMIASANDAAVAIAERIAGSADAFVAMMNARAKELGMTDTEFHSVHGLPPGKGQLPDLMSATDLATLGRALAEFPEVMEWAKTSEAPFRNGTLQMRNTNHLVRTYPGCDGLKTGYYVAAGFEVTATATRDDLRLMAIVLGTPTKKGCFDEAAKLLSSGFNGWKAIAAAKNGATVGGPITVTSGKTAAITGVAAGDLRLVLARADAKDAKVEVKVPSEIAAPVKKGQVVGEVVVTHQGQQLGRVDVVAPSDVESTSWLSGWY